MPTSSSRGGGPRGHLHRRDDLPEDGAGALICGVRTLPWGLRMGGRKGENLSEPKEKEECMWV